MPLNRGPFCRFGRNPYGPCPLHDTTSEHSRYFSVNVEIRRYHCHHHQGNGQESQIESWNAATNTRLYQAAIVLCQQLRRDIPWIRRW